MPSVFLGDNFSLDEPLYLGRPIANRTLIRSICESDQVDRVLVVGNPLSFQSLGLSEANARKITPVASIVDLIGVFRKYNVAAILCSTFGKKFAQLVHFRNINGLECPVYGITHTLSYQDEVGAIYRMMCAGVRATDGILCTSPTAVGVMQRLIARIQETLSFRSSGPSLYLFPLGYEAQTLPSPVVRDSKEFQVLYIGRLDWQTKADLLVIPRIVELLPKQLGIRFVIAGAADNAVYLSMLQHACEGMPVRIEQNVDDARKNQLYRESHAFFSPADNYQETFGVTILEAKHHGCVPVIADFNGYRHLVEDGQDGFLLRTWGAPVPDTLWRAQILMPDPVYHGWWAAGVCIDPGEAAGVLTRLAVDRDTCIAMGERAAVSAQQYSVAATATRFGKLVNGELVPEAVAGMTGPEKGVRPDNPFQFDYTKIFCDHPSSFWDNEKFRLTERGGDFLKRPVDVPLPQLALLSGAVSPKQVENFLRHVKQGRSARQCMNAGVEPVIFSVALKNGLVSIK